MKVVLSWLREFAPFPDDVDGLIDALAQLGLPVEEVQSTGGVAGVVTARVLRREAHPDAAKVQRVWVDAGDGVEHHVWCGAFNFEAGDLVPFAPVGTALPDGRVLTSRAILGIPSEGMLCSAHELGVGGDHSGIMVLPATATVGAPYGDAIGLVADVVFDVDVTRNRPDCHGHLGVARDLAAWLDLPLTVPEPTIVARGPERCASVDIQAGEACARFTTVVLSGVRVVPSASWMARRLLAAGQRPINNVVDVSNYVMLELNQPNHAYDLDTLGGGGIRVRHAAPEERLTTLDGIERVLSEADLLICDANDVPIGLAGVMGGADTEITDATSTVALECAWFEPYGIAATVARTGLRSDAASRFERGVDPYGIDRGVARFVELLAETCPELVVHAGAVDERTEALPAAQRSCAVRVANVNRILGTDVDAGDLARLLDPIGYTVDGAGSVVDVALPSWRPDSAEEIDVIEEVGRHYGYANIVKRVPLSPLHGHLSARQQRRRRLRQVLVGLGASEVMPSPFLSAEMLADAGLDGALLHITNPLVVEEDVLRPSLRPGLLRAVAFNESHRRPGVWLFEIGHVYRPGPGERSPRRCRSARGSTRPTCRSGCTRRARPRWSPGASASAPSARSRPRCSRRSPSTSAWRCSRSTSTSPWRTSPSRRSGSRPAAIRRAISTWRSYCPTTCRPSGSTRRSARGPATCSSASCRSTATAGRACPRAPAALPSGSGCRRRTAPSSTPTWRRW
jgi:phenylalanyl-tRNA synthetase beta chain